MGELLSIGKILNFNGMFGEVKIGYTAGKEKQISNIKSFLTEKDMKTVILSVESLRFHKKYAIIKFKEINSIDEAIEFKGKLLKAEKAELEKYLEKDEFYITDLMGLDVYDNENNLVGKISGVFNIQDEDIIEIKDNENKEYLIPFVKELVPEIDMENKKIIISKLPGLLNPEEAEENR